MPVRKTVSTLPWPKNDILSFFKFLQKKVSWLDKRNFLHLLNESRVLPHDFANYNPKSYKKMWRNLVDYPRNFFLQKFEMTKCHFLANAILRQPRIRGSRASHTQKSRGLRVVYSKNFSRTTFFVLWRTHLVVMFLSYLPVKQI